MTVWPSTLLSPSAAMRAFASAPPPGANPCSIVIGRSGQAACATYENAPLAERPATTSRLVSIMAVPPMTNDRSRAYAPSKDNYCNSLRGLRDHGMSSKNAVCLSGWNVRFGSLADIADALPHDCHHVRLVPM